ncbi:phytoene desaturase [Klenkia marina]|uniref:Phytoene desaturase n=1 Tax=Klenkia marina TaxID=1960309 RepID=A0A1G4XAZ3_9ACTN|nr:phytoene desaturase family protein [Klenkia marina]SCX38094.1 phytoene desaturase [Klenkia marina]
MARVVVVGAGLGGLAAAARTAAGGHRVTVLEQAPEVGGKLGWVSRDGHGFDTGPSLVTLPQVFADLFAATGDPLDDVLDLVRLDPAVAYRFADGTRLAVPGTLDGVRSTLGPEWSAFLDRAAEMWRVTEQPFLRSPLQGARTLARLARSVADVRTVAPWSSLRSLGAAYLTDPHLRMLLDRYATYSGSDPRLAPAALATVPWVEQAFGSWYVRGGLRRLPLAVADRAVERGADIKTSTPVTRVLVEGGRACGVQLADGGRIDADVVVCNADAAALYGDLLPRRAPVRSARASLARATPSSSGFVLLLALRGRTPDLAHHTVLFPADYDAEFDDLFARPRPLRDPTVYVSAPDDPATRPDADSESWFVLVNAPRQGQVDWDAPGVAETHADHVLDVLARRGLDVRDRVRWREVRTPADLERATGSVGGAIYGTSSNGARAAFLRPANASPLPGLFLVGGSSHPGGGLPLVTLSAEIVAGLVGPA